MSSQAREYKACLASPDCLKCPLPACKYDDPAGYQRWLLRVHKGTSLKEKAFQLQAEGMRVAAISEELVVARRTLWRWFSEVQQEAPSE